MASLNYGTLYLPETGDLFNGTYIDLGDVYVYSSGAVSADACIKGHAVRQGLWYDSNPVMYDLFHSKTTNDWLLGELKEPWYSTRDESTDWYRVPRFPTLADKRAGGIKVRCPALVGDRYDEIEVQGSQFSRADVARVSFEGHPAHYCGLYKHIEGSAIEKDFVVGSAVYNAGNDFSYDGPFAREVKGLSFASTLESSDGGSVAEIVRCLGSDGYAKPIEKNVRTNRFVISLDRYSQLSSELHNATVNGVEDGSTSVRCEYEERLQRISVYKQLGYEGTAFNEGVFGEYVSRYEVRQGAFGRTTTYRSDFKKGNLSFKKQSDGTYRLVSESGTVHGYTKASLNRSKEIRLYPWNGPKKEYVYVSEITTDKPYTSTGKMATFVFSGLTDWSPDDGPVRCAIGAVWL